MQQRFFDLEGLDGLRAMPELQAGRLEQARAMWQRWRRRTRRWCVHCQCVMYVRGPHDTKPDDCDLDEVFRDQRGLWCFRCWHGSTKTYGAGDRGAVDPIANHDFYRYRLVYEGIRFAPMEAVLQAGQF